jgi:hypothetical protein
MRVFIASILSLTARYVYILYKILKLNVNIYSVVLAGSNNVEAVHKTPRGYGIIVLSILYTMYLTIS